MTKSLNIRNFFKDVVALSLGEGILKGVQLIINILIARNLTVEHYGLFNNVFAVTQIFSIISDYGMSILLINECRHLNKNQVRKIVSSYFPLKIFMSVIFILLSMIIGFFDKEVNISLYMFLTIYNIIQFGFINMMYAYYRVTDNFKNEAFTKISNVLGFFIGVLVFLKYKNLNSSFLPYFLSSVFQFSLLLINIKLISHISFKNFFSNIKDKCKKVFIPGTSQVLSTIFTIIPFIFLRLFYNEYWVGIFSASYKIILPLIMLSTILTAVFLPRIDIVDKNLAKIKKISLILISIGFIIGYIFVSKISESVMSLIYGKAYIDAGESFWILFPLPFISFISQLFGNYLIYRKSYKIHMLTSVIGVSILIISFFVIKSYIANPSVSISISLILAESVLAFSRVLLTKENNLIKVV